jgi:hypothetical protein
MSILRANDELLNAEEAVRYASEQLRMRERSAEFARQSLANAKLRLEELQARKDAGVVTLPKLADGRCCWKSVVCPCGGWSCDEHGQRCRLDHNGMAHHD